MQSKSTPILFITSRPAMFACFLV